MKKNFFYFYGGAVGGFLAALFLIENLKENNNELNFYIVVPQSKNLLDDLSKEYGYINIVQINRRNFLSKIFWFLKKSLEKNIVVFPPTFGRISLSQKIIGKILTFKKGIFIGFENNEKDIKIFYTKILKPNRKKDIFETMKQVVTVLDYEIKKKYPILRYVKNESLLRNFQLEKNKYIAIHPFATSPKRSLSEERCGELIDFICQNFGDFKVVLTGSKKDKEGAERIAERIICQNLINLAGILSIQDLINILDNSFLYIGVDTGVTHLAGVLQKRSLIIGNQSNPTWLPAYNKNAVILYNTQNCPCAPCNKKFCLEECRRGYFKCMEDISETEIKKKIQEMLDI